MFGTRSVWAQDELGSRVNGLISIDYSDHYITPRGLNVEDQGVVAQPLTLLFWKLHTSDKAPINEISLTTGLWNSFHSRASGAEPTRWNEIDPVLGVTFKFKNRLKVDAFATSFYTPTESYATSSHLDLKVTLNDVWGNTFSVNPVAYFHLRNEGPLDGNQVLANSERQRNLARVRAGISVFF
jgi:hypothetical protein